MSQVDELLAASFTVMVTVWGPKPTKVPTVGFCEMVNEPEAVQLSVAVTSPVTLGTEAWQLLSDVAGAGSLPQAVMFGAVVSTTVTST